jgi:hypothetical protein
MLSGGWARTAKARENLEAAVDALAKAEREEQRPTRQSCAAKGRA